MNEWVESVLAEEWEADDAFVAIGNRLVMKPTDASYGDGYEVRRERARQAALGHRALRFLANPAATFADSRLAQEAFEIVQELRHGR